MKLLVCESGVIVHLCFKLLSGIRRSRSAADLAGLAADLPGLMPENVFAGADHDDLPPRALTRLPWGNINVVVTAAGAFSSMHTDFGCAGMMLLSEGRKAPASPSTHALGSAPRTGL